MLAMTIVSGNAVSSIIKEKNTFQIAAELNDSEQISEIEDFKYTHFDLTDLSPSQEVQSEKGAAVEFENESQIAEDEDLIPGDSVTFFEPKVDIYIIKC